jgi:hypothetical protein
MAKLMAWLRPISSHIDEDGKKVIDEAHLMLDVPDETNPRKFTRYNKTTGERKELIK